MPSIQTINVASPLRLGAVERSPHYALPLNAETLTSHIDDSQLSAGSRKGVPAREGFSGEGCPLTQLDHCHTHRLSRRILAPYYSHLLPKVDLDFSENFQSYLSELRTVQRPCRPPPRNELTRCNKCIGVTAAKPLQRIASLKDLAPH